MSEGQQTSNVVHLQQSGPPGPPGGGIDARMSAVEAGVNDIKAVLSRLEPVLTRLDDRVRKMEVDTLPKLAVDVAEVKARVSQLPTTLAIFAYMGGLIALTLALFGAASGALKYLPH